MKRSRVGWAVYLLAGSLLLFWSNVEQRKRLRQIKIELDDVRSRLSDLHSLKLEMNAQPAPEVPEPTTLRVLQDARRELFDLRSKVSRLREAARWDIEAFEKKEGEAKNAIEALEQEQQQQAALRGVAAIGNEFNGVAESLVVVCGALIRKNVPVSLSTSVWQLHEQLLQLDLRPKIQDYYTQSVDELRNALDESGLSLGDFEIAREGRFFQDQQTRNFLRPKVSMELPDGRKARPYWPIWDGSFRSPEFHEFRLSPAVFEDLKKHIYVVYDP